MSSSAEKSRIYLLGWILWQPSIVIFGRDALRPWVVQRAWYDTVLLCVLVSAIHVAITRGFLKAADIPAQPPTAWGFSSAVTAAMLLASLFPGNSPFTALLPILVFTACAFWNVLHAEQG